MCTNLDLRFKQVKIASAKAAVDKEWEKIDDLQASQVTKVKSKKEVIEKAHKKGRTVRFATLMDKCNLKNSELEQHFTKMQRSCRALQ